MSVDVVVKGPHQKRKLTSARDNRVDFMILLIWTRERSNPNWHFIPFIMPDKRTRNSYHVFDKDENITASQINTVL